MLTVQPSAAACVAVCLGTTAAAEALVDGVTTRGVGVTAGAVVAAVIGVVLTDAVGVATAIAALFEAATALTVALGVRWAAGLNVAVGEGLTDAGTACPVAAVLVALGCAVAAITMMRSRSTPPVDSSLCRPAQRNGPNFCTGSSVQKFQPGGAGGQDGSGFQPDGGCQPAGGSGQPGGDVQRRAGMTCPDFLVMDVRLIVPSGTLSGGAFTEHQET